MSGATAVFDGHNDLFYQLRYGPPEGGDWFSGGREGGHIDLPRLRASAFAGGIFALFARRPDFDPAQGTMHPVAGGYRVDYEPAIPQEWAYAEVTAELETAQRLLRDHAADLELVRDADDLERVSATDRIAVVLHLEGAEAIGTGLEELDRLHASGLRSLGLVWSRPNAFAEGVPFRFPSSPDTGPGLSAAGRRLVERCEELGILVDLAHLNERGFWDVAEISSRPLVVSHADVHSISPSTRNLTDAQIDRIGASGGLIGVNFNVRDLRPDGRADPDTPIELIARHAEYVIDRIGVDHVGFGSDLDGAMVPAGLGDVADFGRVVDCLRDRGHEPATIEKIAFRNWHRVLAAAWARTAA